MSEKNHKLYCFDTSAFINSWRLHYPPSLVHGLWDRIGEKIEDGTILIPNEVKKELGNGNDDLVKWLKPYHPYVIPISTEQIDLVSEIVNKYPLVSQYKKPRPAHADPFVVAIGKLEGCTVVTYEGANKSPTHPKIPDLCKEYGIKCCSMIQFFDLEQWRFKIS